MKKINKKDFVVSKDPISMTSGEMLATVRRLQELTQSELAKRTRMTQANISNMELGRQKIGRERAQALAKVLRVHPAVIMFPDYRTEETVVQNLQKSTDPDNAHLVTYTTTGLEGIGDCLCEWHIYTPGDVDMEQLRDITAIITAQKKRKQMNANWRL